MKFGKFTKTIKSALISAALAFGTLEAMTHLAPTASAIDVGLETKIVAFGTNGVAVVPVPPTRSGVSLVSVGLMGLVSLGSGTQTFTIANVSGGTTTNGRYSLTIGGGTSGTYTNFTASDQAGIGDAIVCALATSNIVTSTGVATNLSKLIVYDTQSTNGLGYSLQTISTNTYGYTNVTTFLRVVWRGYSL